VVFVLKCLLALAASLPLSAARAVGRSLGMLFYIVAAPQRSRALDNLSRCFPDVPPADVRRRARRVFCNMGVNQLEMLRWMGGRADELRQHISATGMEHAAEALARKKGVLVLTAHIGNWDLMGLWGASQFPLTIISKELKNPALNAFWMEKRRQHGLHIVAAHNSYRACLSTLKRGECLGFVLDQNMTRADGIFVEFFGRPACTTPGLAVLSAHAGAPVLPVFMIRRDDGRHEVTVLPCLEPPATRKPPAIAEATQRYTSIIEGVIRQHPDQWIWMHRRWKTQPAAAPAV
jgi:KDO2-lipid IV(A) lauroyltransferase